MLRLVATSLVVLATSCNLFSSAPGAFGDDAADGTRDVDRPTTDVANDTSEAVPDMSSASDLGADLTAADVGDLGTGDLAMPDLDSDMAPDVGPDAAIDLSDDPCSWPETVFCDGFEHPMLDPWSELEAMDATYTRATFPRRTGFASVRFDATGAGGSIAIQAPLTTPLVAPASMWLRLFVNLPSAVGNSFALVAGLASDLDAAAVIAITPTEMTASVMLGAPAMTTVPLTPPRDQWVCVEMFFDAGANGRIQGWVDGSIVVDELHGGTAGQPLGDVFVGFIGASGTRGQAEDVIVSGSRPGCD